MNLTFRRKVALLTTFLAVAFGSRIAAADISVANVISPGWKDHRPHTLVLGNNRAHALNAVFAVKTYKRVPNSPACLGKDAPISLVVGGEALVYETRTERIVVPAHGEAGATYESFYVSLIGEEPPKQSNHQKQGNSR